MAFLSKQQVKQIIDNAPDGSDPAKIVDGLVKRGHTLEGLEVAESQQDPQINVSDTPVGRTLSSVPELLVKGPIKSVGRAAAGATELVGRGIERVFGKTEVGEDLQEAGDQVRELLESQTAAEEVGGVLGDVVQFFLPQGAVAGAGRLAAGVAKGAQTSRLLKSTGAISEYMPRAADALTRAASEGILGAIIAAAQRGDTENLNRDFLIGGALPIAGTAVGGLGRKIGRDISPKIVESLIKPTKKDLRAGFDIDNVFKHDLAGDLEEIAAKSHQKIVDLSARLSDEIKAGEDLVDITSVWDKTKKELLGDPEEAFGQVANLRRAIQKGEDELFDFADLTGSFDMDLVQAQQVKRSVGKLGAWFHGVDQPELKAMETLWNKFYINMKEAIETAAPDKAAIQEINRALSEIIPVEQAVLRRIPVANRNNAISLTDILSFVPALTNPANMWLFVLNRLSKSGSFAEKMRNFLEQGPQTPTGGALLGDVIQD